MKGGIPLDLTGDWLDVIGPYMIWRKTRALVVIDETASVPEDTLVWHFARILGWVSIGEECSIGAGAEIGRGAMIGMRTRISANVFLPPHAVVGSSVFIGPGATFTDDRYPRILDPGEKYEAQPPVIDDFASIGAGATILPGVKIGKHALIGAGAMVVDDVPDGVVVVGNPAYAIPRRSSVPAADVPSLPPIGSGRSTTTSP